MGVRVEISNENADFLDKYALTNFGRKGRAKVMDYILNEKRKSLEGNRQSDELTFAEQLARVDDERLTRKKKLTIAVREFDYECLSKLADDTDTGIYYYINALIINHLYNEKRLLGNELEVLRKSNYELARIGINLNQIARVMNENGKDVPLELGYIKHAIHIHTETIKELIQKSVKG